MKALELVEKDQSQRFVNLFIGMGQADSTVDTNVAAEFVCTLYGLGKADGVNEARYKKLLQMTGKINQVSVPNISIISEPDNVASASTHGVNLAIVQHVLAISADNVP